MTININIDKKAAIHRTALWGTCFLMGAAALTACGEGSGDVATVSAGAAAPSYASSEQVDREAFLALQAEHLSGGVIARPVAPYVSPEQVDRQAQLAVQVDHVSAGALDQRATESTSAWASAEDFERRGVESKSAQASVDALERRAFVVKTSAHASADALDRRATNVSTSTSAHPSADALEHWATSEGEG